ncbi:MAG: DoxX family protein [Rubrivivax sp.]|nr:DoxX family protein [Rubrivivax sp.]
MKTYAPIVVIARVLLALMFVLAGFSKFGDLGGTAGYIASKGLPMPQVLAFLTAALEVVGGLALAIGFQARWAALALALFTLLASVLFHNFWAAAADQQFVQQLMFMKNLSIVGGLLFVFSLGAGPASIDARRAASA